MSAAVIKFPDNRRREVQSDTPQVDDGYTRIANELLSVIARTRFSQRQFQVLLAVVRKTYGFQKKADRISDSQLVEATGLKRSACCEVRNELLAMGVLFQSGNSWGKIGISKDYRAWNLKQKRAPNSNLSQSPDSGTNAKKVSQNLGHTLSQKVGHTKDKRKEKIKDSPSENPPADSQTSSPARSVSESQTPKPRPEAAIQNKSGSQWGTETDLQLAEMMAASIDSFLEQDAPANRNLASWANTIRLMRERDGRQPEHIRALFAWAHGHHFWKSNILSPGTLREKWPQLGARRKQEREDRGHESSKAVGERRSEHGIDRRLSDPEYAFNNF